MIKPIPEEIKDYLKYDPITGDIVWIKKASKKVILNVPITTTTKDGYIQIMFKGINYRGHRIAWFLHTGEQPPKYLDHRNNIRTDNAFTNLRVATASQNNSNRDKSPCNTSGYKGVNFHAGVGKWRASISINNKAKHLGWFDTPELANESYQEASLKIQGEFSFKHKELLR